LKKLKEFSLRHSKQLSLLLLSVLSLFNLYYGIIPAWNRINSDFPNYYVSSKLLLQGKDLRNIYNDEWFQQKINEYGITEPGKFSPFPPPTALIMIPLSSLSPFTAKRVYLIINLIVLFFAALLVKKISGFNLINSFNIILLSGAALINNFLFGQFYLILLLLILLGYLNFIRNNESPAGIFWGIASAVKYFPVIYIPILFFKKKWKALFYFAASVILLNIITFIFFGSQAYLFFFRNVIFSHLNGELSSQSGYAVQFQSWNSFLRNLFIYDPAENPYPLISSIFLFNFFRIIIFLFFPAAAFFVLNKLKMEKEFIPASVIILSLVVFVLSPASATYHLLIMILPVVLLLKLSAGKNIFLNSVILLLYILTGLPPLLVSKIASHSSLFLRYSRLWLEAILFFVSLRFLLGMKREENYLRVNLRSEIPNGAPSVKDL